MKFELSQLSSIARRRLISQRSVFVGWLAVCLCGLLLIGSAGAEEPEPEEGAPVLLARELVDPSLLRSSFYSVNSVVEVKDLNYLFTVHSRHGEFHPMGVDELLKTLHELEVIEKLEEVSQTEAFANALAGSFKDPLVTSFGVARRPIASVVGLPGGIVRYLGGKVYQVKRGSGKAVATIRDLRSKDDADAAGDVDAEQDSQEKKTIGKRAGRLSRKHLGHDAAKRKWARKLKVDPYSDNMALQEALGRIAWASSLGDFAGDFAVPSSEVFSYAGRTQELVWDRPAHQLEREMMVALKNCAVERDLAFRFRDSSAYSLTEKTELRLWFESLKSTESVPFLVDFALKAETKEDANLFLRTVKLLARYAKEVDEIKSIGERRGLLVASSKNGYDIYPLAVDYLHWTPLVYEALLADELWGEKREIWVSGEVSPIARLRLKRNGWQVFDHAEE